MTAQEFFELRSFLSVAHHIPGRIRLKFDPEIRHHPAASALAHLGQLAQETVETAATSAAKARLNIMAHSLVIEYDTARIAPADIDTFMGSPDMTAVQKVAINVSKLFGITLPSIKED